MSLFIGRELRLLGEHFLDTDMILSEKSSGYTNFFLQSSGIRLRSMLDDFRLKTSSKGISSIRQGSLDNLLDIAWFM